MSKQLSNIFNWLSQNGAFFLSFISILGAMVLALKKDSDINSLLPTLLGLYLGHQASRAISSVVAASRDAGANTNEAIRDVENIKKNDPTP